MSDKICGWISQGSFAKFLGKTENCGNCKEKYGRISEESCGKIPQVIHERYSKRVLG